MSTTQQPLWISVLERGAVLTCVVLWLLLAGYAAASFTFNPGNMALLAGTLWLGFLAADFASGVVHWFCDTFFEESTPGIGRLLIASFREHHRDALAMTRHSFFELNGNSCIAITPVLGAALWLGPADMSHPLVLFAQLFLLSFSAAITATNQFHCWAHDPQAPAFARILQGSRLILSPADHARHHAPPHAVAYCVTSGWMNGVLDYIGLFAHAEHVLVTFGFPYSASSRPDSKVLLPMRTE